jgi:hypothetical protein
MSHVENNGAFQNASTFLKSKLMLTPIIPSKEALERIYQLKKLL